MHSKRPSGGGICAGCRCDLEVGPIEEDGGHEVALIYCTNRECKHHTAAHPARWWVNAPGQAGKLSAS